MWKACPHSEAQFDMRNVSVGMENPAWRNPTGYLGFDDVSQQGRFSKTFADGNWSNFDFCTHTLKILEIRYLIDKNLVGSNFSRQNFSSVQIWSLARKCCHFLPGGIFDPIVFRGLIRQKKLSAKIFVGKNFTRQFLPTKFLPIRYYKSVCTQHPYAP